MSIEGTSNRLTTATFASETFLEFVALACLPAIAILSLLL